MSETSSWCDLIGLGEIERGDATPVTFEGTELAVFDTVDGIAVAHARCTHAAANLCDGYFDGRFIECPLHQGLFDARTGEAKGLPATRPLRMIETRVREGRIEIRPARGRRGTREKG